MFIYKRVQQIRDWVESRKAEGLKVGFVPTMGALHYGHLSLVERSREETDVTIVSIFVNPKQFNDPEDLRKYPRPIEADLKMLYEGGVDMVFLPEVEDIYPVGDHQTIDFDPGPAAETMEGKFRPGHFDGVCQVVKRLLDLVMPTHLYMGQKDFQQFTIIQYMLHQLKIPVELVVIETSREKSGLARSSRNTRLSPAGIKKASVIYRTMSAIKEKQNILSVPELENYGMKRLKRAGFEPEYVTISDSKTLKAVDKLDGKKSAVLCLAAWLEGVRLIDNILL